MSRHGKYLWGYFQCRCEQCFWCVFLIHLFLWWNSNALRFSAGFFVVFVLFSFFFSYICFIIIDCSLRRSQSQSMPSSSFNELASFRLFDLNKRTPSTFFQTPLNYFHSISLTLSLSVFEMKILSVSTTISDECKYCVAFAFASVVRTPSDRNFIQFLRSTRAHWIYSIFSLFLVVG